MTTTLVVDHAVASCFGDRPPQGLIVAPTPPRRRRRAREHLDAVADVLGFGIGRGAVLTWAGGDAELGGVAAAIGHDVVHLPAARTEAAWAASVAGSLAAVDPQSVLRVVEVLAAGPRIAGELPRRPWGATEVLVPALRPATLARWATRAWTACDWCHRGGARGCPCSRCGSRIVGVDAGERPPG